MLDAGNVSGPQRCFATGWEPADGTRAGSGRCRRRRGAAKTPARWNADFESGEADAINRVHPVTGGFESIVNNLVEAASAACKLVGIAPATGKRSGLQGSVEALRREGCFTAAQASLLDQAYTMTSLLRHISPTVDGEALRHEVRELLAHHHDIVRAFVTWLDKQGIEVGAATE